MCGIYGIVGNAGKNRLTLAKALCVFNASRGDHSAGIATADMWLQTSIYKSAVHPFKFARSKEFGKLASAEYRTLIGHTRFATFGTISDKNAHPFRSGATIGIHNGCVANVEGMSRYLGKKFQVDSQYIIHCLDKHGHIGPAQGSLNVAWFGAKDSADLRLIRFGNPLCYAIVNHGKALVFSSEKRHLRNSMSIANLRGKIVEFPDDQSASVFIDDNGQVRIEFSAVPCLSAAESAPYEAPQTTKFLSWKDYYCDKDAKRSTSAAWNFDRDYVPTDDADDLSFFPNEKRRKSWHDLTDLQIEAAVKSGMTWDEIEAADWDKPLELTDDDFIAPEAGYDEFIDRCEREDARERNAKEDI